MRRAPSGDRSPRSFHWPLLRRIDRAAEMLNPVLIAVAIGLATVYVSCLAALEIKRWAPPRHAAETAAPALGEIAQIGLPRS